MRLLECDKVQPVPLSEELFIKLGFKKHDYQDLYKKTKRLFAYPNFWEFHIESNESGSYRLTSETIYYTLIEEVVYAHDLQNIFYSMQKEELTYKL